MRPKSRKTLQILACLIAIIFAMTMLFTACNKDSGKGEEPAPADTPSDEPFVPPVEEEEEPYYTRETVDGVDYIYFGTVADSVVNGELADALESSVASGTSVPDENGVFKYTGSTYIAVISQNSEEKVKFSDGSDVVSGKRYFIKIEPIKWRVLEEKDGVATLLAEKVIGMSVFNDASRFESVTGLIKGTSVAANDYEHSDLKSYVEGEYLEGLLTAEERTHLNGDKNAIKLLNSAEIEQFSLYEEVGRMVTAAPTDYLILQGIDVKLSGGIPYAGWWLTDAGKSNCFARYVNAYGQYGESVSDGVSFAHGIRPVIALKTTD